MKKNLVYNLPTRGLSKTLKNFIPEHFLLHTFILFESNNSVMSTEYYAERNNINILFEFFEYFNFKQNCILKIFVLHVISILAIRINILTFRRNLKFGYLISQS